MTTAQATMTRMLAERPHWQVPLMDFVDDVRRRRDPAAIAEPFVRGDPNLDALLASVIEYLCDELGWPPPVWLENIPPAPKAWFVSGLESLKSIALSETPPSFRSRRIFVLENFLTRV